MISQKIKQFNLCYPNYEQTPNTSNKHHANTVVRERERVYKLKLTYRHQQMCSLSYLATDNPIIELPLGLLIWNY